MKLIKYTGKDDLHMKTFKKIFYTIFGLFIATIVGLVGVILYAEYSGKHFSSRSLKADDLLSEDGSRLVYDENGNIAEFPDGTPGEVPEDNGDIPMPPMDSAETDASVADTSADIQESSSDEADNQIEQVYIMDMGANLFHTRDCSEIDNINEDERSEMTTTRGKIMNAGYEPCSKCNP